MNKLTASFLVIIAGWFSFFFFTFGARDILARYNLPTQSAPYQSAVADNISLKQATPRYYVRVDAPVIPEINARAYVAADIELGTKLLEKNAASTEPIASISKLFTAITSLRLGLKDQTKLYPLLLESNNEVANSLASEFGYEQFMSELNEWTREGGMTNTYLTDSSGLSYYNVSTVDDLLKLATIISKDYPELLAITKLPEKSLGGITWYSNNSFAKNRREYFVGGKSGYTPEAGGTLLSIFQLPNAKGQIAVIVLGADGDEATAKYTETNKIVDYILANIYYK